MAFTKVALVTGAARGIGRAISMRLAADGFNIALNDLATKTDELQTVSDAINKLGRKTVLCTADVSVEEEVAQMVKKASEQLGGLDAMVANAGTAFGKPIVSMTAAELDRIYAINVRSTFLSYKYAGQQMISQGRGGRIVGASSIAGKRGYAGTGAYSATKFAIKGLTQSAAMEFGTHNITVNAYAPGPLETPLMASLATELSGEVLKHVMGSGPLSTKGTVADVASLVSYLVSSEARYITGQTISANGGIHCD